jgi:ubiquinone/menaquinone biosynthesis C-methylase UbiE
MPKLDVNISDVNEIYSGPIGKLWEMLMGDHIHVGGEGETLRLAQLAGVGRESVVLDVCSALGGPARLLAKTFGCKVVGLDATKAMIVEAKKRIKGLPYASMIDYRFGNAIDMPFKAETFDIVWGQDAWCYITDKNRLIEESFRVLKKNGTIAFTDWAQTGDMSQEEWMGLNGFMTFPYLETIQGYTDLLNKTGFEVISVDDKSENFAKYCKLYQDKLRNGLKNKVVKNFGKKMFETADKGLDLWVNAANSEKVGRCRIIARKYF